jgi:hypothetical protein
MWVWPWARCNWQITYFTVLEPQIEAISQERGLGYEAAEVSWQVRYYKVRDYNFFAESFGG